MHQEESAPHVTGTHTALPCCFALKLVGFHTDQHVVRFDNKSLHLFKKNGFVLAMTSVW